MTVTFSPQSQRRSSCQRIRLAAGFTLVELLVVIAIIGILVGLLVPAIQNMREMARRSQCEQNLVQMSLALSSYSSTFGHYPAGTVNPTGPIKSEPVGYHHNWISEILPYMDAEVVYNAIDRSVGVYDPANDEVRGLAIPNLRCPSATTILDYSTSYAGMSSSTEQPIDTTNDGVFVLNLPITDSDIKDGLSYTMFVGEKTTSPEEELGWISGTRCSLRNGGHVINAELARIRRPSTIKIDNLYVGGLSSDHLAGAYTLMGSGEYHFRSTSMDMRLLSQLISRAGGEIPIDWNAGLEVAEPKKPTKKVPAETAEATKENTEGESLEKNQPAQTSADESAETTSSKNSDVEDTKMEDTATKDAATEDSTTSDAGKATDSDGLDTGDDK